MPNSEGLPATRWKPQSGDSESELLVLNRLLHSLRMLLLLPPLRSTHSGEGGGLVLPPLRCRAGEGSAEEAAKAACRSAASAAPCHTAAIICWLASSAVGAGRTRATAWPASGSMGAAAEPCRLAGAGEAPGGLEAAGGGTGAAACGVGACGGRAGGAG